MLRSEYPDQIILELAADYVRRGVPAAAVALLAVGMKVSGNPLLRAWRGWLEDDPTALAGGADPTLVFPFRRETLMVLQWAAARDDHWSWSYLLALNLWALDREAEAAKLLTGLGDRPDFAPFYVSRAHLLGRLDARDPEQDLRRAVQLDDADRTVRLHLVRYLQARGRWEEALAESGVGRTRFPGDFNLDLLHVRSLNELGRPREAIDILTDTHVLPSEDARESHRLYEQAFTLAAVDAMERGAFADAQRFLGAALEWPERLGQGRPYEPDERLARYLLGVTARRLGGSAASRAAFTAVVEATEVSDGKVGRLDLLAIPAFMALGQGDAVRALSAGAATDAGAFATDWVGAIHRGEDAAVAARRLAGAHAALFADLDGRLLLRALSLAP
jgi:hypothetical protein